MVFHPANIMFKQVNAVKAHAATENTLVFFALHALALARLGGPLQVKQIIKTGAESVLSCSASHQAGFYAFTIVVSIQVKPV